MSKFQVGDKVKFTHSESFFPIVKRIVLTVADGERKQGKVLKILDDGQYQVSSSREKHMMCADRR